MKKKLFFTLVALASFAQLTAMKEKDESKHSKDFTAKKIRPRSYSEITSDDLKAMVRHSYQLQEPIRLAVSYMVILTTSSTCKDEEDKEISQLIFNKGLKTEE